MTRESSLLASYSEPHILPPTSQFLLHVGTGRGIQGSRIPSVLGPGLCSIMSPFSAPGGPSHQSSRAERGEQEVTVTSRPNSSESLELGPKQSGTSQWLPLHMWSIGSISRSPVPGAWPEMPPFLDPSKKWCEWCQAPLRTQS